MVLNSSKDFFPYSNLTDIELLSTMHAKNVEYKKVF